MKIINEASVLLGILEHGELNQDLSAKLKEVVGFLRDLSMESPKTKFKGEVTLTMKFEMHNDMVTVNNEIKTKIPKVQRRGDVFWATDEGALSTEHPAQRDMFGGPRVLDGARQN
ncbi:hypothetical protein GOZ97_07620 [Agrobacterium vitis]|uniref:hypothetical protein n=1 Tax=Agrobacterium vitis TaxID=373 RepID=UPI0008FB7720|nr:hypothetical protein [Agrobacterium vitis]MUZ53068.1 hypothetical protein [Agrobacterium vitis]MUZ91287.1 hypothetical protein [Agrobacterium vitis]MVA40269.1 hypothetical protein [Agrobacterium vitis]NSX96115.1 hypothetical protein [Agrobacterium vitis]NSZ27254.1 hypothetical protein [Agrobacterium vitis]